MTPPPAGNLPGQMHPEEDAFHLGALPLTATTPYPRLQSAFLLFLALTENKQQAVCYSVSLEMGLEGRDGILTLGRLGAAGRGPHPKQERGCGVLHGPPRLRGQ